VSQPSPSTQVRRQARLSAAYFGHSLTVSPLSLRAHNWGNGGQTDPIGRSGIPPRGILLGWTGGWVRVSARQESLEGVDDGGWLFLGNVVAGGGDCSTAVGAGEVGRVGVGGMERGDAVVDAC
jgi:hypothetical protein